MNHYQDDREQDDAFAATRMSFGDHIEELRLRLWWAAGGLATAVFVTFVADFIGYSTGTAVGIARPMLKAISAPVRKELESFDRRRVAQMVKEIEAGQVAGLGGMEREEVPLELDVHELASAVASLLSLAPPRPSQKDEEKRYAPFQARIPPHAWARALASAQAHLTGRYRLKVLSPTESVMVYFKVALACGVVLASPWIFWQIWSFIAAGLYAHEKRGMHFYLPVSLGLFLAGVAGCQFVVMPRAIETLLGFSEWLGFEPDLRLSEWLSFAIWMPLVFGLSFQTPLVMLALERFGIVTIATYRGKRRLAWFLLAVLAAAIIPSMDAPSMLLLWVPLGLLYELGIWFCRLAPAAG